MKRWQKWLLAGGLAAAGGLLGFCGWLRAYLPDSYTLEVGGALTFAQTPYVHVQPTGGNAVTRAADAAAGTGAHSMQLRLFGILPLKTVWVREEPRNEVQVSGAPFGVKLFSDGVMVVGFSDIYTATGYQNPAKSAGLHMGDAIHSVNGENVATNEDIQRLVESSQGRPVSVTYSRKGEESTVFVTPVQSAAGGAYRVGMRVRDSSAGIGTLTYYDPQTGGFAGLGHPVTDVDTGESIEVRSGQIVSVTVTGTVPSSVGSPGELKGILSAQTAGDILQNDQTGIFGLLRADGAQQFAGQAFPVAARQEVCVGEATMYTCLEGSTPQAYRVVIERIRYNEAAPNKNMIVRMEDPTLLEKTGGIVQGMSGSPIVQNGRLVGAVTHVLVNDPTRGYAVFAENMLEAQQQSAQLSAQTAA